MTETPFFHAVVFDMDGVLLDSETVYDICWRKEAGRLGLPDIDSVHRQCLGRGEEESIQLLKAAYGAAFDGKAFWDATDRYCAQIEQEQGMPLKPFAREILTYLRNVHYPLALASSTGRATVQRQLGLLGFDVFFDAIICGDEVAHAKPAPDIYRKACELLGAEPRHCIAIEDSPNGVLSAHRAGLSCVMIPDRLQPDEKIKSILTHLCTSLDDLKQFL